MAEGRAALSQAAAIAGLGGIGKTQTAIEYAYRYALPNPDYPQCYDWAFWVQADTELNVVTGLADIARSLNFSEGTLDELAQQARRWLATHDRWLLIFDNADDPQVLRPWLLPQAPGRVLLTSRSQRFVTLGIAAPLTLPKLSAAEAIAFLQDRCDRPALDAGESAAVVALARELDGLPLALEQAAAYIQQMAVDFAVYWQHFQQRQLALLERGKPETGDYPASVATTWPLNFEQVAQRSPASVPILQLSAVLAGEAIPEELLLVCAEEFGLADCTDAMALAEQLAALADFSLIGRERATDSYSIHRLVQAVVWQGLTAAQQQDWMQRAVTGLNAVFPDVEFENWAVCGRLVPHVQALAERSAAAALATPDWARLLNQAGCYLDDQGRYAEAEPLFARSLSISEQQLGPDHPDVATSLNNLANLYDSQGRYADAEPRHVRSLSIREQQLGPEHPDVATSLNNLAELYRAQGRYAEAEPLLARSLSIREQQLGPEHPDVAQSLNNLALLYNSQGRYAEAEPLYARSLSIYEQQLGPDHPDVASSLNNLAELYRAQGRYAEAESLYARSLSIREQQLGPDHPDVAISLNNLALLYKSQGRYAEAEPLYARSLSIWEQQLGPDHLHVAASLNNLASLYQSQGRYAEAEPLYGRSLSIYEQQLGPDHPDVANSLWNLAALYYTMQRLTAAQPLITRAVALLESSLGPDHPHTRSARQWWQIIHNPEQS
jgi:tetratricopeptide (TPR) repeat protein